MQQLIITGEVIVPATANRQDKASADIHARGFLGGDDKGPFLMSGIFIQMDLRSYRNSTIPAIYRRHEQEKKKKYGDHVQEADRLLLPL